MSGNQKSTVYIGNLDERVTERVLYDILIQAGRVVDLHFPKDRETDKPKGFAFAEYETEEIADYATRLFSGLVTLYNRTLKFAISGQDKAAAKIGSTSTFSSNSPIRSRNHSAPYSNMEDSRQPTRFMEDSRQPTRFGSSGRLPTNSAHYESELLPPGTVHDSNTYRPRHEGYNYDYSRKVFGSTLDSMSHPRSGR